MTAIYQQNLVNKHFPYNVIMTNIQDYPPHWHEEYEIIYNFEEAFELRIGDEIVTLEKGDIYIIEPRIIHAFILQEVPQYRFILQFIPMSIQFIEGYNELFKLAKCHFKPSDGDIYNRLKIIVSTIIHEEKEKKQAYEYYTLSGLYDLIGIIIREIPKKKCSENELSSRYKKLTRLQQSFDFVESNYHKNIRLADVASQVNYSSYYFTRFFKDMTGMTFNEYLSNYRIIIATRQLLETDYSITEISLNVGFSSIKTFNRVFKSIKNCSPSQYRKQVVNSKKRNI